MPKKPILRVVILAAALLFEGARAFPQEEEKSARLWKDPGHITERDLFWGSGAAERAPKGPFVFLKDDPGGAQPKIEVLDASGRQWDVKFGEEVHAEIAANRLVWALGYVVEEFYYVPNGIVTGMTRSTRVKPFVAPDGSFRNASFRLRHESSERTAKRWTFAANPFVNTRELSGLAILMTMVNNWDIKGTRNNRVLTVDGDEHYIVSDVGATFGKMGKSIVPHSKWNLRDFKKEEFIEKVQDGKIDLDYEGYGGINRVPLTDARWFAGLVAQLTDEQLEAALKASGANDVEVAGFAARLREKITELQRAVDRRD